MRNWTRIGIAVAAGIMLAGAATGATVYALRGGDDNKQAQRSADDAGHQAAPAADEGRDVASICIEGAEDCDDTIEGDGSAGLAMCAPGFPDCNDMVILPVDGDAADCAADGPGCMGTGYPECAPGMACIEPWLMDPPVCPDGVSIDDCFPDGVPPGYECLTLESFPVQIKCYPVPCEVYPLPLPAETPLSEDELKRREEEALIDPAVAPTPCVPPTEPCGGPAVRCLPPDCAVSSDGSLYCTPECVPGPAVDCVILDCEPGSVVHCIEPDGGGQSEPGSGGGSGPSVVDPPPDQ